MPGFIITLLHNRMPKYVAIVFVLMFPLDKLLLEYNILHVTCTVTAVVLVFSSNIHAFFTIFVYMF